MSRTLNIVEVSPTKHNDVNDGYEPGAIWVDTKKEQAFICVNNEAGKAKWSPVKAGTSKSGGVTEHVGLTGLGEDDHPQYALSDGSRGDFASVEQGQLAESAVQPGDSLSVLVNDLEMEGAVTSVAGKTGVVELGVADIVDLEVVDLVTKDDLQEMGLESVVHANDKVSLLKNDAGYLTSVPNLANVGNVKVAAANTGDTIVFDGDTQTWQAQEFPKAVRQVGLRVPEFLNVSGGPITDAGTLVVSLSGHALPATNGGTGHVKFSAGDILFAMDGEKLAKLPVGQEGQVLTVVNGLPTWVTP